MGAGWRSERNEQRRFGKIAKDHGITIFQLGLAWLLGRSPVMLPIPGTSSLAHLEENMAARKIQFSRRRVEGN